MQDSVLLAASTEKSRMMLQSLVSPDRYGTVKLCQSSAAARRYVVPAEPGVAVISAPLSDESGLELAMTLAHQTIAGVLLLVKADLADTVASRVEEYGVQVLSKPVAKPLFDQALRFSMATRRRMLALQEENQRLEKKLAELRLVDRAKCVLIQYLGMTEEQAHRQIEKQAMDTRQTKAAIARAILATYEM